MAGGGATSATNFPSGSKPKTIPVRVSTRGIGFCAIETSVLANRSAETARFRMAVTESIKRRIWALIDAFWTDCPGRKLATDVSSGEIQIVMTSPALGISERVTVMPPSLISIRPYRRPDKTRSLTEICT